MSAGKWWPPEHLLTQLLESSWPSHVVFMLPVNVISAGFTPAVDFSIQPFSSHFLADMFSQHLDIELSEEDVQILTSDCKAKTHISVLHHS